MSEKKIIEEKDLENVSGGRFWWECSKKGTPIELGGGAVACPGDKTTLAYDGQDDGCFMYHCPTCSYLFKKDINDGRWMVNSN